MQGKLFNPHDHIIHLKSKDGPKDYLPVQWRLVWFRERYPQGTIDTEEVFVDLDREEQAEVWEWNASKGKNEKVLKPVKGYARYKAIVTTGEGGRATGHKAESAANFKDFCEKSETGAEGRALAALGFGTQFSDEEFAEGERIVDAPVPSRGTPPPDTRSATAASVTTAPNQYTMESEMPITEQQLSSIRKLHEYLGKAEPEGLASMSNLDAKTLIQTLTAEYRQAKARQQ